MQGYVSDGISMSNGCRFVHRGLLANVIGVSCNSVLLLRGQKNEIKLPIFTEGIACSGNRVFHRPYFILRDDGSNQTANQQKRERTE